MSLYYEAAQIVDSARSGGGSFKSIIFGKRDWKSDRKALFALTTEASKWSEVLSEVVENSEILKIEKQLSPTLALLLTHDLLLSKKGPALPQKHGLHVAISRHKATLTAQLTKARLRRGVATQDALRAYINNETSASEQHGNVQCKTMHPRWIRINTLRTTLEDQLTSTFAGYKRTETLSKICSSNSDGKLIYIDEHVPNLLAVPSKIQLTKLSAYKEGKFILQDKASCFPAYLLIPHSTDGDVIDACAAPGNKTTHLAAILSSSDRENRNWIRKRRIIACEKDGLRSQTLTKMVDLASADDMVTIKAKQDFLRLDPQAKAFSKVYCLLLDPSCSGSGMVGRDSIVESIQLPDVARTVEKVPTGKKRKRGSNGVQQPPEPEHVPLDAVAEEVPTTQNDDSLELQARLSALSTFQVRMLKHAMAFPRATRIAYSTCSVHNEENEFVVTKALLSDIAFERGWRIMNRQDQVAGMRKWHRRGRLEAVAQAASEMDSTETQLDAEQISEACIRCDKGNEDGTMGFFLAGFVRDEDQPVIHGGKVPDERSSTDIHLGNGCESMDEEWDGFSDREA